MGGKQKKNQQITYVYENINTYIYIQTHLYLLSLQAEMTMQCFE